jgi:hypothetical protein
VIRYSRRRSGGRHGALAALTALLALGSAPLAAQGTLEGRVLREGEGVAGVAVELHRVGSESSGLVDATTTAAGGRFLFALPPAVEGSFTVLFATATVHGVRYFGRALHPDEDASSYVVEAFDTTSAPGAVGELRISRRDVILVPGMRGGWEVAEVVRVENPLRRTVVGAGGVPVFGFGVPAGAAQLQTEEPMLRDARGAESPQELVLMGGRVLATVPLTPGPRDFFFRYRLPAGTGTVALPLGTAVDTLTVYVREPAPGVRVDGLADAGPFEADGDRFARFVGADLPADASVTVRWSGPGGAPVDPRAAAGAAAVLVLLGGAFVARRRRSGGPTGSVTP